MAAYVRSALLVLACGLAGYFGPPFFLREEPELRLLALGLVAGAGAGGLAGAARMVTSYVPVPLQGVAGGGAAVFTWLPVTLTALFQILPPLSGGSFQPFDLVWLATGTAPPFVLLLAYLLASGPTFADARWHAVLQELFVFSVPLWLLRMGARATLPAKADRYLILFAGILFLTLDYLLQLRGRQGNHTNVLD